MKNLVCLLEEPSAKEMLKGIHHKNQDLIRPG